MTFKFTDPSQKKPPAGYELYLDVSTQCTDIKTLKAKDPLLPGSWTQFIKFPETLSARVVAEIKPSPVLDVLIPTSSIQPVETVPVTFAEIAPDPTPQVAVVDQQQNIVPVIELSESIIPITQIAKQEESVEKQFNPPPV